MLSDVYSTAIAKKSHTLMMRHGRFQAGLMRAPRLVGDSVHSLPPGIPVPIYPVDALPGCPVEWVKGSGNYVCPVAPDWGLWFDFTMNDRLNTAILMSIKGLNPITGQKIENMRLEQFKDKCQIHKRGFKGERYCPVCGYQWPCQNYLAAPNTLWRDGWLQPDGSVRQFFFTEDEERDVASAVIGERNTVPAFGFAFFEPRTRREEPPEPDFRGHNVIGQWYNSPGISGAKGCGGTKGLVGTGPDGYAYDTNTLNDGHDILYCCSSDNLCFNSDGDLGKSVTTSYFSSPSGVQAQNRVVPEGTVHASPIQSVRTASRKKTYAQQQVIYTQPQFYSPVHTAQKWKLPERRLSEAAKVAVGAGARIQQDLTADPLAAGDWKDEPSAIVRLYFVFQPKFEAIAAKGVLDLEGSKEGFLKGVKVG